MTPPHKLLPALLVLAGCAAAPVKPVQLTSRFDADQANLLLVPGPNTVRGSALLRQNGGGVVTCAGTEVFLIPATAYARERIRLLYGTEAGGYVGYYRARVQFEPDLPSYTLLRHSTRCDPQGHFKFDKVADGEFYLLSTVTWKVGDYVEGGGLTQLVKLGAGNTREVVLTAP